MRHGDLAVLVTALLFVGHLVFDLQRAGPRLDHLLGEQVSRLGIAEAGIDIGDDRNDMRFVLVDFLDQALRVHRVIGFLGGIQFAEQAAQFAGIGLVEEGVEFLDQPRDRGLLVHRLVGERAEFAAQRGDHPTRQVKVTALGAAEMLLDRDHLLLRDEAMPGAKRLSVVGRIAIVGIHVLTHDLGGVARDIESRAEPVLDNHARSAFGIDGTPGRAIGSDGLVQFFDPGRIGHGETPCRNCISAWPP